ncbi:MAG: trigger factor [Gammaproteobacteria bacterium]
MDVSVENTGGLERRMKVQVPAERVDQEVQSRLQSMSKTIRLDGFRPGKVPVSVIEKKYGNQIRLEVVDQVINSTLQEALTQENIRPAGEPDITPGDSRPGVPLEYTATFEVFPEFSGGISYSFKIEKPVVDIVETDITSMLDNLRRQRATWNPVDRPAALDDQITIDFEGSINGASFAGNKADNVPIVLGSNSMIPGFEEQLVGVSAGEEKTLDVTFPDNYASAEVAGKSAQFEVKVHSVAEMVLPELDDDLANAFGVQDKGIAGLREEVTNNMRRELKQLVASTLKDEVFGGLLGNNPLDVPRKLIESELEHLKAQQKDQEMVASVQEASAERRVKLGVLISEIIKQNQINVDPDRVRDAVETVAASYEKPDEVVQWYYGNQEALAGVQSAVLEEQVVEWIMENTDVEIQEKKTVFADLVEKAKQSKGSI